MSERPTIDLDRKRGDWIEVPNGPLDRPRNLYAGMALSAVLALGGVYLCSQVGLGLIAICMLVPAVLFGVCLAGLIPAAIFRRDRT